MVLGLFVAGLIGGGLLSATVLWLFSGVLTPVPLGWRLGAMLVIAVLGVLRDLGLVRIRMPQNARQVPQDVLQRHLLLGSLQFGFELGTGVRTFVSASAPYVVALVVLLSGEGIGVALLTGAGFGLGRAATPLFRYASGAAEGWDRLLARRLALITVGAGVVICLAIIARLLAP